MMDGRVAAIRRALDSRRCINTPFFLTPPSLPPASTTFREAADSAPQFGDRRSYQMDPANVREAMREIDLDIAEGADIDHGQPALRISTSSPPLTPLRPPLAHIRSPANMP